MEFAFFASYNRGFFLKNQSLVSLGFLTKYTKTLSVSLFCIPNLKGTVYSLDMTLTRACN